MSPAEQTRLQELSIEERLYLVEAIWKSLAMEEKPLPLSESHRRILDARLEEHKCSPESVVNREAVLAMARGSA